MKKIVHISDLHFGTEHRYLAEALLNDINVQQPALVVVSGDLTQRARKKQFVAAKNYLGQIQFPVLVVPGNHDIPLFDIFRRFLCPLKRYKKYISEDVNPFYKDDEMAVLGINTARSFTWKNGRISVGQIQLIKDKMCDIRMPLIEVLVTHHQFIPPPDDTNAVKLVGRADLALETIDKCGIDLLLAGHLHVDYTGDVQTYHSGRRSMVVVQAGTAISRRVRGQNNAYNIIILDSNHILIHVKTWNGTLFDVTLEISYRKSKDKWLKET